MTRPLLLAILPVSLICGCGESDSPRKKASHTVSGFYKSLPFTPEFGVARELDFDSASIDQAVRVLILSTRPFGCATDVEYGIQEGATLAIIRLPGRKAGTY